MNIHHFFWSVKGRLPPWAVLAPLLAGSLAFALGPFVQPSFSVLLVIAMFGPLALCLILAYTYWAIALPLLYGSYLGLLFPEFHPSITPWAVPLGIIGGVALALGVQSEWKHGKGKQQEILARYGISRIPWKIYVGCGALGVVGVVLNVVMDTLRSNDFFALTFLSLLQLVIGLSLRQRESSPNQVPEPAAESGRGSS